MPSSLQASTLVDSGLDLSMVGKAFLISMAAAMYPLKMSLQLEVINGSILKRDKTVLWELIYLLSVPEFNILKDYIDDNLKKGYICSSKSPAGAPIFFIKSWDLRPITNYRGLNVVTAKKRCPLSLIHKLLAHFTTVRVS